MEVVAIKADTSKFFDKKVKDQVCLQSVRHSYLLLTNQVSSYILVDGDVIYISIILIKH